MINFRIHKYKKDLTEFNLLDILRSVIKKSILNSFGLTMKTDIADYQRLGFPFCEMIELDCPSFVTHIGYNKEQKLLRLRFRDSEYDYFKVPESMFKQCQMTVDFSEYFHRRIKDKFEFKRIDGIEPVEMNYIKGSAVASVFFYDHTQQILRIEFNNGKVYDYYDVETGVYNDLKFEKVFGKYFFEYIREQYKYKLVGRYNNY